MIPCWICGEDHGVQSVPPPRNDLWTAGEEARWLNTQAHAEANYRKLKASGVLDPLNNKHLYEHLRGIKGYEKFCAYIFGDSA